jgi:succinate-acetate transporter protein
MAQNDQMPEFQQSYTNEHPHDSDKTLERQTTAAFQAAHPHLYANPNHIQAAFGGALQPGLWKPVEHRKFANPAPLGLCAFALTTFVLSCINMHTRGETSAAIAIPVAFGYGGLVQLLAGMWYVSSATQNLAIY